MRALCSVVLCAVYLSVHAQQSTLQCGQVINDDLVAGIPFVYSFVSPVDTHVSFSTCDPATSVDTLLTVNSEAGIVENDDYSCLHNPVSSTLSLEATANRVYSVQVAEFNSAGGPFRLAVQCGASTLTPLSCGVTTQGAVTSESEVLEFTFVPEANELVQFSTCNQFTDFDTEIEVLENGSVLQFNDDSTDCSMPVASTVTMEVSVGNTYTVRVFGHSGETGLFQLSAACIAPVHQAISCGFSHYGSIETGEAITYEFSVDVEKSIVLSTCNANTNFDTQLTLIGDGMTVATNDDASFCMQDGTHSTIAYRALPGVIYTVKLEGFGSHAGSFQLEMTCGLTKLGCGEHDVGAVMPGSSVLYDIYASSGPIEFSTCSPSTNFDTVLRIYADGVVLIANDDDPSCGISSSVSLTPAVGVSYQLEVSGFSSSSGTYGLRSTCAPVPLVPHLVCGDSVPGRVHASQTVSHFLAVTQRTQIVLSTCSESTNLDTTLAVTSGAIPIAENDDDSSCVINSRASTVRFVALPGVQYTIRIAGFESAAAGDFQLTVQCVSESVLAGCGTLLSTQIASGEMFSMVMRSQSFERVTISTCNPDTTLDTYMTVRLMNKFVSYVNNDDKDCGFNTLASSVTLYAEPGDEIWADIIGRNGASGTAQVRITCGDEDSNDHGRTGRCIGFGLGFLFVCIMVTLLAVRSIRRRRNMNRTVVATSSATPVAAAVVNPLDSAIICESYPTKEGTYIVVM